MQKKNVAFFLDELNLLKSKCFELRDAFNVIKEKLIWMFFNIHTIIISDFDAE